MLLLRQNIHLLVHMLLIGRVIWLTHHFYFLINEGGVEELHRVTILVHDIIHCLLEHGGEITIHSAWTAFLASLAALTQHNRWRSEAGWWCSYLLGDVLSLVWSSQRPTRHEEDPSA